MRQETTDRWESFKQVMPSMPWWRKLEEERSAHLVLCRQLASMEDDDQRARGREPGHVHVETRRLSPREAKREGRMEGHTERLVSSDPVVRDPFPFDAWESLLRLDDDITQSPLRRGKEPAADGHNGAVIRATSELEIAQAAFAQTLTALQAGDTYGAAACAWLCGKAIERGRAELWRPVIVGRLQRDQRASATRRSQGMKYLAMVESLTREGEGAGLSKRKAASEAISRALPAYCAELGYEVDRERFRQYMRRWRLERRG